MIKLVTTPPAIAFRRPWPGTRRGLCLWFFALAYMYLGLTNYILTDPPALTREALAFPFSIAPPPFWGAFIMAISAFAMFFSYCHFGRDKHGFKLLSVFAACWGGAYICGFLLYDSSLRATAASVIWFLFSIILLLTSGLPSATPKSGYPRHCSSDKEA